MQLGKTIFPFILIFLETCSLVAAGGDPSYLVIKTFTSRNAIYDTGKTEIYKFVDIKSGFLASRPVVLRGSAPFTLPSERDSARQEAIYNALSSYPPTLKTIHVSSATIANTGRNALGTVTQITSKTLFIHPQILYSYAQDYKIHVVLKASIALGKFLPSKEPEKIQLPILTPLAEIGSDMKNRFINLLPF